MEKTYKVLLYEYQKDSRYREMPCQLYTSLELIELVEAQFDENVNTIDDARQVIRMNGHYAREVVFELTNNDFIGNIKPDGTMTQTLDLGSFATEVERSEDLVANFHELSTEQQKVICSFIDKAEQLLSQINKRFESTASHTLIKTKAKDILNDFVHDLFISDDRPNPDAQTMNMGKFNAIDLETLFDFLVDTIYDMPVTDLMTDDFGTLSMYTNKFWHKILVKTAKNS